MAKALVTRDRLSAPVINACAGCADSAAASQKILEPSLEFLAVQRHFASSLLHPCALGRGQQRKISLPFVNKLSSAFESLGTDAAVRRAPQSFKRHTMSQKLLTPEMRLIAAVVAFAATGCVAGCGKATPETPTAVRVKQVEERQRTDPNFFLKEKSVATPAAPAGNAVAESSDKTTGTKSGAVTTR
jgi:hypothetical protein